MSNAAAIAGAAQAVSADASSCEPPGEGATSTHGAPPPSDHRAAITMTGLYGFDAFSPPEIGERVEAIGVTKARLPLLKLVMLGILAGAFIALGALFYTVVAADASLAFGVRRVLGGLVFCLGLILVVVAGAELFTGNNLLAMAWAEGKVTTAEVLRNWGVVALSNLAGAVAIAVLALWAGHAATLGGAVGDTYLRLAEAKTTLPFLQAFASGILCNVLVCLAVWMAVAGRSVVDKAVAIVFPITAFVAAGFEHSVANMYFIPMALLLKASGWTGVAAEHVTLAGFLGNLVPVILGNLVGGSVFVALVYHVIYRRGREV